MMTTEKLFFDEDKLYSLLEDLGIKTAGGTETDLIAFCPFHSNENTPAFNISKVEASHPWHCWSGECGERGTISSLVARVRGLDPIPARRFLLAYKPEKKLESRLRVKPKREYEIISKNSLRGLDTDISKLDYMVDRGFSLSTLRHFMVGNQNEMIVIPVFDENNSLVGFTRRPIESDGKRKYFDKGLPKKKVLFNLNNAKRHDSVIIVEGPMDCMMVHQAGFPNVVAVLSGDISDFHAELLRRHARSVIIFTDQDEAGQKLGGAIEKKCKGLRVYWASYPNEAKDPCDLGEDNIRTAIENKKNSLQRKLQQRQQQQ